MLSDSVVGKISLATLLAALCVLPACSVNVRDKASSKEAGARVDIQSPVGDLHVDEQADIRGAGLTIYPGAKPAPKDTSEDKKSANVNLSLPGFALKVVAAEYVSDDAPDKLIAYYDKEMQRFGKPIQCQGRWRGGDVEVDSDKHEGLSKPVACGGKGGGDSVEIKVGTQGNQHIAAIKSDGKGSRFALVYVRMHAGKEDTI